MILFMQAQTPDLQLSCVIPAYNEAASIRAVVTQVIAALRQLSSSIEIIVIDDGSQDDTVAQVRELCRHEPAVRLLQLSRNFGKEVALTAGLQAARGRAVILMDADGQHPTSLMARMVESWQQGYEMVYTVRRTRNDQSRLHRGLTRLFYRLVNLGSRTPIPPNAGDYRLLDRRVVDALLRLPERHRFMKGLYAWVGYHSLAIDYEPLPRLAGQSNFGLFAAMRLGATGLLGFTAKPLRALGLAGLCLSLLSLFYGLWVVLEYFLLDVQTPGYATLAAGIMFLSGVQLMSIGLLAEYVARIYDEVKQRPLYLVAHEYGQGLPPPNASNATPAHKQKPL